MDAIDKLINYHEVSRLLTGSSQAIRSNKIPIRHEQKIKELKQSLIKWMKDI